MIPLDFSMITCLEFRGHPLRTLENIGDQQELVVELLGAHLNDYLTTSKWFIDTFRGINEYTDDQMTRAFIMYISGCFILCLRGDRIHLSFLGSLENIEEIHTYNWGGAGLVTIHQHIAEVSHYRLTLSVVSGGSRR